MLEGLLHPSLRWREGVLVVSHRSLPRSVHPIGTHDGAWGPGRLGVDVVHHSPLPPRLWEHFAAPWSLLSGVGRIHVHGQSLATGGFRKPLSHGGSRGARCLGIRVHGVRRRHLLRRVRLMDVLVHPGRAGGDRRVRVRGRAGHGARLAVVVVRARRARWPCKRLEERAGLAVSIHAGSRCARWLRVRVHG